MSTVDDNQNSILVAEDSATQARHLQYILETHGYRATVAANGRLALEAARKQKPALVISDVMMPEMNGYELCTLMKSDPALSSVPVILVTTLSDPQDVIRGLECRADNFILKPYDPEQLMRRVQFVLVNSHMRRTEQPGMGLEIVFSGQRHFITADRLQILNLLLSTYEAAIQRNRELSTTRDTLRQTNEELQQLTRELEDRVLLRTRELEQSNEALRQAQKALIQQERLSALGQMASGIAHDINNAISPVALYTESLLERETTLSDRARQHLTAIERAINDVARTVARMREFYRPQEQEAALADVALNDLVQHVVDRTRARWSDLPERQGIVIHVRTVLAPDLPPIGGADNEIRDALTNLIFNAVDAMPEGGTITVRTSVVPDIKPRVRLEVEDNGTGMDEETRRKCLEPFFTTKGERGTGLGLAMVYGMAQRHGATVEILSKRGVGTTIRLMFPARAAE
jgi:signal transduction histidine kinase